MAYQRQPASERNVMEEAEVWQTAAAELVLREEAQGLRMR